MGPELRRGACMLCLAVAAGIGLPACAPLILGGAALVGGTMVVTDRRTSGTQVDDEAIELKAIGRLNERFPDRQISVTSFNRVVLLTGVVYTEDEKAAASAAVGGIDTVRSIANELTVSTFTTSLVTRSNDSLITSRVKASLVDARDLFANAFKVVTERGTVYLMGRVTEREAKRASDIASSLSGVQNVVRLFEIITEADLAKMPLPEKKAPSPTANPTRP